jgi:hypothetical protein
LYGHDDPNKPTKEEPFSFVLFEPPFTAVSTVSRGHPSLFSLDKNMKIFRRVNSTGCKERCDVARH